MPDPLDAILKRLDELVARIERVESHLHLSSPQSRPDSPLESPPESPPESTPVAEKPVEPAAPTQTPTAAPTREPTRDPTSTPKWTSPAASPKSPSSPAPPPPPRVVVGPESTSKPQSTRPDKRRVMSQLLDRSRKSTAKPSTTPLEFLIGGKGMAIVGGFIIVLAMGVLMKVGYDYGWWGRISPGTRCLLAGGFGIVLLGLGELAFRRVGRMAAIGLFGAGLGTLYITAFATTWRTMNVLPETGAFLAMGIVALIGVAITVRGQLLSIGALSIVAGYVVPVLVQLDSVFLVGPALYFTVLLAIALGLSVYRTAVFGPLRVIGIPVHAILVSGWVTDVGSTAPTLILVFMTGWWGMMIAETIVSAIREHAPRRNAIISLLVTAWFIALTCWALSGGPGMFWTDKRGLFTAGVGLLSLILALQLGPGLDSLRRRPETPLELLVVTFLVQAAGLLVVAVALHFTSYGQAVAWLVIALSAIEAGRHIRSRGLDVFGLIALFLALARIIVIDSWMTFAGPPLATWAMLTLTPWSVLFMGGILTIHAAAHRFRPADEGLAWRPWPILLTAIGLFGWLAWWQLHATEVVATGGWLLAAAVLVATARWAWRLRYAGFAVMLTILTAGRWLVIDTLQWRYEAGWSPLDTTPFANLSMAMAAGIAVVGVWAFTAFRYEQLRRRGIVNEPVALEPQVLAGVAFLWIAMSFQLEQFIAGTVSSATGDEPVSAWPISVRRELWLSLFWMGGGVLVFVTGAAQRLRLSVRVAIMTVQVLAIVWLSLITGDMTSRWSDLDGVPLVLNLYSVTGAALGVVIIIMATLTHRLGMSELLAWNVTPDRESARTPWAGHWMLIGAIVLWIGTTEISRFFAGDYVSLDNPEMARESTLSAFWGVYAITLVIIGFALRRSVSRYVGLTMLVATLGKVLIRDMAEVEMLFRVASLLAIGILLVVTSVIYAKLAPRLLGTDPESGEGADEPGTTPS